MTFFARLVVALFGPLIEALPEGRISRWLNIHLYYLESLERVRQWHRRELERLDPVYRLEQASKKLLAASLKAREAGLSAGDPSFPTLADFVTQEDYRPRPRK